MNPDILSDEQKVSYRLARGPWNGPGPEPLWLYVPPQWPRSGFTTKPAPECLVEKYEMARQAGAGPQDATSLRRSMKPRIALGERPPAKPGGG
jgi:hypothetical protein